MADGAVFTLESSRLGANALGEVHLHAAFRNAVEGLAGTAPFDVLDAAGMRLPWPAEPAGFLRAVESFDVPPSGPHTLVVYDDALAGRIAEAFPGLPRAPRVESEDLAFELRAEELALDPFGLAHLAPPVQAALDAARCAAPNLRAQLFAADGEPVRDRPTSFAEQLAPLAAEGVSTLNGTEPHWLVLPPAAAAAFARHLPGLARARLAELEFLWRRAREEGG